MRARLWLPIVAVASLSILVYAGVLTAFSVPVTPELAKRASVPGHHEAPVGTRALVMPIGDVSSVPTRETNASAEGVLLLVADEAPTFVVNARNATLAFAVAYVAPTANGSYFPATLVLTNVTYREGDAANATNMSLDVGALAGGKKGFLVREPVSAEVRFVETERVLGTVARYESGALLPILYGVGVTGFVAPLAGLVLTHRGAGARGLPEGACAECRAPMARDSPFCSRCGAWPRR